MTESKLRVVADLRVPGLTLGQRGGLSSNYCANQTGYSAYTQVEPGNLRFDGLLRGIRQPDRLNRIRPGVHRQDPGGVGRT